MNGKSPFPRKSSPLPPARKFKVTFIDEHKHEHVAEVDPSQTPAHRAGQPGSLLEIALNHGVEIGHACGGVCACATCHVIVREGMHTCNEPSEAEENELDEAYGLTVHSRLACQCVPTGEQDLVVEIPAWNRNLARESS